MTLSHFLPPSVCDCLTHQGPNWSVLWQIEEDTKNAAVINGDKPQRFHKQVSANFYPMCRLASSQMESLTKVADMAWGKGEKGTEKELRDV